MKTTTATKFPHHLLFSFEKGYNAIPGARAVPINNWSEFRQALRQLKDMKKEDDEAVAAGKKAPNGYETIIIDTADIAYDYCEKYICANAKRSDGGFGVDAIADIPFGKGYGFVSKEFDECLRSIVQMNYGLVIISHATDKTFTDEKQQQYNKIVPTLDKRANNIIARMCDLIGYSRIVTDEKGNESTKLFLRGTSRFEAGSRFKYTPDYIDFSYKSLVNAIGGAIDKQAKEDGTQYFTDTRENAYKDTTAELDFDELIKQFNDLTQGIVKSADEKEMNEFWMPRIQSITDKYLGRGNKVGNMAREQVEALSLIVEDLKDLISTSKK